MKRLSDSISTIRRFFGQTTKEANRNVLQLVSNKNDANKETAITSGFSGFMNLSD